MTIFQILAAIFALSMMYVVSIHGKKKTLSPTEVGFWLSLWTLFIVIALFPNLLMGISQALLFNRVFDLLVVAALMILTILVFASYFRSRESHKRVERLVRQLALDEKKMPRKSLS